MAATEAERAGGGGPGDRWVLAGLLVFTLIVRSSVLWLMRGNLEQDPDAYREIAENLIVHGEFALGKPGTETADWQPRPTAYRPPLYPMVLSNLAAADGRRVSLGKVAGLHLMLGVATVWLTWGTARRFVCRVGPATPGRAGPPLPASSNWWAVGRFAALSHPTIAGLIVACDPILLNQQTLVMTETLAAFLAVLALWCLARFDGARTPFNAALAGGAMGLAVLCRPTFLPWLGLVAVGMIFCRPRNSECRMQNAEFRMRKAELRWMTDFGWRGANVGGLILAAAAVVSPWAVRNYRVFGKAIVTTTHGGYTLLLGNNESFYDWLITDHSSTPWKFVNNTGYDERYALVLANGDFSSFNDLVSLLESDEKTLDATENTIARDAIFRNPAGCAIACAYRLSQLWSPLPHMLTADESVGRRWLRYATCGWYCGVYALVAMGVWRLSAAHGTPQRAFPTALWRGVAALFQPPWVWGVLMCVAFTAVHTFYWTNLRMRAPLMPFVAMVAAAGVDARRNRRQ